ncbi:MAG: hypothetical protein ACK48X_12445 [Planctomycetota bacterium]
MLIDCCGKCEDERYLANLRLGSVPIESTHSNRLRLAIVPKRQLPSRHAPNSLLNPR